MSSQYSGESMLEVYIFETSQNIEQLETVILSCEKTNGFTQEAVNEIFRMMHTIKGSSAMMLFNNISTLAHVMEDMFYFLREEKPQNIDDSALSDLVLGGVDFIKVELEKIKAGDTADGDATGQINAIKEFLDLLKQGNSVNAEKVMSTQADDNDHYYITPEVTDVHTGKNLFKANIFFEDGCEMENIRAYTVIHNIKDLSEEVFFIPEDILDNDNSIKYIREHGFTIYARTDKPYDEMNKFFMQTIFLKDLELVLLENDEELSRFTKPEPEKLRLESSPVKVPAVQVQGPQDYKELARANDHSSVQSIISVNVNKLDKLMDLMGEIVIAEAMVTQNPDLNGLKLDNFRKASNQLHKITGELQDMVMSIRMVPLSTTFHKMQRIIRDMSKKLNKEVELELTGEETEVDKNIIEHISDPLMHLVRNSLDHGIEAAADREASGKPRTGKITLEAKNAGSDVLIIVRDDGRGLNKEKILKKAVENNLFTKPQNEMTEKEIYNLIFLPGFSTKEAVSEFSGRGVGMDVVVKNIEAVGGSVSVDSVQGSGTSINLRIPLTLAIIDGMNISVGDSRYTIPITAIRESFRPNPKDLIEDPDGNEMIMVRGNCYPILRLHQFFRVNTNIMEFNKGILIMVEQDEKTTAIFADELLGQQQVVVKTLPNYIKNLKHISGLSGCTLLGDGNISLILDIAGLM
ncbi:MAG: chemotaxis protein CheA [Bacillota bacterium]|nr:chemotaxis protein CheA [Bacillota bacterium]